jgi:hypothetical protein
MQSQIYSFNTLFSRLQSILIDIMPHIVSHTALIGYRRNTCTLRRSNCTDLFTLYIGSFLITKGTTVAHLAPCTIFTLIKVVCWSIWFFTFSTWRSNCTDLSTCFITWSLWISERTTVVDLSPYIVVTLIEVIWWWYIRILTIHIVRRSNSTQCLTSRDHSILRQCSTRSYRHRVEVTICLTFVEVV